MTMTAAQLRKDYSEFQNPTLYPDPIINEWIAFATLMITPSAQRWGSIFDNGVELFTAHYLVLGRRDAAAAAVGGMPGEVKGPANSKSVDKVSVGYDTQAVIELEAGHWNLTTYGLRFIRMSRMIGTGGIQVC